jgi:formate-nitrite transporter family protein
MTGADSAGTSEPAGQRAPAEARPAEDAVVAEQAGGPAGQRARAGARPAEDAAVAEQAVEETFVDVVDEGRRRLARPWVALLATGAVGGIDVGTGVLALLLVLHATGSMILAGLAFPIGFIAVTLARSELFTEDFLIPVSAVIARQAQVRMLARLWVGTLIANLAGGWAFTWFVISGFPQLRGLAVRLGSHYADLGIGARSFSLAVLGGAVITLMTWMQHGTSSSMAKITAAVGAAFLLAAGGLDHVVVSSLQMFAALHTAHAPFGYSDWAVAAGWATAGNLAGGIGLVTVLRLLQVPHRVAGERARPAPGVPLNDS